jgi:Zn-dependent protease
VDQRTAEPGAPAPRRERGTLKIGQIGGVDVLVRSSWLLIAGLISVMIAPEVDRVAPGLGGWKYVAGVAFAVLLYLSVLLHEMSHALMAKHYGLPVKSITLHFLGGVTEIEGEPETPGREFWVSVVGPLTSIAVGLFFLAGHNVVPSGLLRLAVDALAWSNLVVGVLNLVPGLPLDGGRVLRAAVWKLSGSPHRGTIVAGWGGRVTAVAALAYPTVLSQFTHVPATMADYLLAIVIAAFLWGGASQSIMAAKIRSRLPVLNARTLARRALVVPHDLPLAEAVRRAQEQTAGSIVILDAAGQPSGIVNEAALLATPEDRRPWLPVSSVSRSVEQGLMFPADLSGEPLIRAMQRTPATEYLLLEKNGSIYGVLTTDDVDKAFAASM